MSPTSATGGGSPRGGTSHSNGSGGANSLLIAVSVGLVAVPVAGILAAAGYVAHGHGWL